MNTKHSFLLCTGKGTSPGSRQALICALVCFFMGISPSAWAADTIISGQESAPQVIPSDSLIITGGGSLTVSSQNGTDAGSAVNVASGNFTVTGTGTVSLNGNKAESTTSVNGGAAAVVTGLFTLESSGESQFFGNTAFSTGSYTRGGALFAEVGIGITNGTNIFSTNRAITESSSNDARGGALFSSNTITISGGVNSFTGNTVSSVSGRGFGGALSIEGSFAVTISGGTNTFTGNTASSESGTGYGGAIYTDGDVIISGGTNTFENNRASGGTGYGGAIASRSGEVSLSGTTIFRGNTASTSGGAVWMGKTGGLLTLNPVQATDVITFATATDTIGGEDLSVEISGAGRVVTNALNTASSGISSLAVQSGTLQLGTADTNSETFFGGLNTFTLNGGATLAFYADTVGNRTVPYIAMQDSGGTVNLAEGSTLYAVIGDRLRAVQTAGNTYTYTLFSNAAADSTFNAALTTSNLLYVMQNGTLDSTGSYTVDLIRTKDEKLNIPENIQAIIDADYNPLLANNAWLDMVFFQTPNGVAFTPEERSTAIVSAMQTASLAGAAGVSSQLGGALRGMLPNLVGGGVSPLQQGGVVALAGEQGANLLVSDASSGNALAATIREPHFALWATPLFRSSHSWGLNAGFGGNMGFKAHMTGALLGGSATFGPEGEFRVGAMLSGGAGQSKSSGDFLRTKNDSSFIGGLLFGQWQPVPQAEVTLYGGASSIQNKVTQNNVGTLKSDFDSWLYQAGVKAEYAFTLTEGDNPWLLVPSLGVDMQHYKQDSFTTKMYGSDAFHTSAWDTTLVDIPLNIELRKTVLLDAENSLNTAFRVGYRPTLGNRSQKVNARLANGSMLAEITGVDVAERHNGTAGLGLEWEHKDFTVKIDYDTDYSSHHIDHALGMSFGFRF